MTKKKAYFSPIIEIVLLDVDISICMTTEFTEPDPGDKPVAGTVDTFKEEENSGFSEDPFKR